MRDVLNVAQFHAEVAEFDRTPDARPSSLTLISPTAWAGLPVPDREWIVEDWIPAHTVSVLTGEGATGKSTLALQLAISRAIGRPWLSLIAKPGRTLYLSCEDDGDELHRRVDALRAHYAVDFGDLDGLRLADLVGQDAILATPKAGDIVQPTELFAKVVAALQDFDPDLCIIDALADAFAGDENKRSQARQFIGLLKRPARQLGCAFLAIAHPSLTGINSGTGSSGSTAWANSVRSRIFFEKAKATDGSSPDPDLRTLTVNKSNYGPAGNTLTLKWPAGVYVVQGGIGSLDKMARENRADETFLALLQMLNLQGQDVSPKPGPTYAPTIFAKHPNSEGIGKDHFANAMQRLLTKGSVKISTTGSPSKQRSRLLMAES